MMQFMGVNMIYRFDIPEGVQAKTFILDKISDEYTFYSLYAERVNGGIIECNTFTLPTGISLGDFIDYLENESWVIYIVSLEK